MSDYGAWAGLGQALQTGGDAYARAKKVAAEAMMHKQQIALQDSEIGKNNAQTDFYAGKTKYNYGGPTSPEGLPVPGGAPAPPVDGGTPASPGAVPPAPAPPAPKLSQATMDKISLQDNAAKNKSKADAAKAANGGGGGRGVAAMLNLYQKGGMGSIASGSAAIDRLTQASNALGQNDDSSLKAIAGHYAASNPNMAAMLQTKQGQPLSLEDRQNIFNGVQAGVADEINKLSTQSNSAVSPGMFANALKQMPDSRMDANHRATSIANMREMLLKPGLVKYLDTASSVREPDGTFSAKYKANGLENQYNHALQLHKQIFGQDYAGNQPLTTPMGTDLVANPNGTAPAPDRAAHIAAVIAAHKAKGK